MAGEHYIPEGSGSESSTFEVSEDESDNSSQASLKVGTDGKSCQKKEENPEKQAKVYTRGKCRGY